MFLTPSYSIFLTHTMFLTPSYSIFLPAFTGGLTVTPNMLNELSVRFTGTR
jgi:hypothetical protein